MGKYMRKSKPTGEVAIMEVSHSQPSLGVRTRAKTLALQRSSAQPVTSASYLQLRSRRLEKPPILMTKRLEPRRQKPKAGSNSRASSRLGVESRCQKAEASEETAAKEEEDRGQNEQGNTNNNENADLGVEEASFGENVLEFEGRERTTRESTPCSLIRDPDTIRTPGSTTRPTNSAEANRRIQNSSQRHIPTAHDMNEFFAGAEEEMQKKFVEKYNFDPVNDKPLPGRYEWEKVDP
ncbi:cyclin-dependent kinase inhibitor 5-like [Pyrus ussuriensis x Pyrus communis]|uniref:Cyclin-dependent kinase inhibitor 5-like n=1 Tax=Pyrus ussuriensis x Pyrus communis TaxID=2448454 RepID=A0A5N5H9C0_9ROSA|nr:cyclin-dependent kinase inhibitor 5-like [Pyrus ussuriensis x Pyrus communis]